MPLTLPSLVFLCFNGEVLSKNGVDFTRHEGPWGVGVGQGALVTTRTVHLRASSLPLDAVP